MTENKIFTRFIDWAERIDNIRMVVLTSTMADAKAQTDFLSDYDVELYVHSLVPFLKNDKWFEALGDVMVRWPLNPASTFDKAWVTRLVLFEDGTRIDFQVTANLEIASAHYDNGCKVLLDKDGLSAQIAAPTYTAYNIRKPTEAMYLKVTSEFWWNAYYVPKYLWREQLPFAKYMMDYILRYEYVHQMVDWYIGLAHKWQVETGALGKYYSVLLPKEIWQAYEATFAGADLQENWDAFYRLIDFFRMLSKEVGTKLGYPYPEKIDQQVTAFCRQIQRTPKSTKTR
ncbi:aminoglycoside 6-adenylyltransferase [Fusibacter paucivorans]|uniref:Aminoglycoside 6-adenylyltransferase n=1 Tax=Fusibacter paucivorans TaxID=76009 RepID=A0ABS5PTK4_9FIRM|nr:aminoglycoside 6-adenylyltransferase [Fusibacter paucivorans]